MVSPHLLFTKRPLTIKSDNRSSSGTGAQAFCDTTKKALREAWRMPLGAENGKAIRFDEQHIDH
ncbi:hypothetical protein F9K78_08815 [Brucella pseudintermedia]|nr:hypothetical protein F9K78_08815 [Brucella pseudintermedia]